MPGFVFLDTIGHLWYEAQAGCRRQNGEHMGNRNALSPERLHCLGGDDDDIGYWTRGHHSEADMRSAVAEAYPDGERHSCAADPSRCAYFMGWWRRVPRGDGFQFYRAAAGAIGAFPVTALLTPEAEI